MNLIEYDSKQYKESCGNCAYYLGSKVFNEYNNNCNCDEKRIELGRRFFRNHFPSDEPCKYFIFEPRKEYKQKQAEQIEAAITLKNYCKETECNDCDFYKDNNCKLKNLNPKNWDI